VSGPGLPQPDASGGLVGVAKWLNEWYLSFLAGGFDKAQALALTQGILIGLISNANNNATPE